MAEITTTQSFSDGDTVTATKLNNIQANASIQPDAILNRTAETSLDQANDLALVYDSSASSLKKVTISNLVKAGTASDFPVTGNATVGGTLGVTGTSALTGNTTIGGTLGVTGASTLSGNASIGGTLGVFGASTLTGNTAVLGALGVSDTVSLTKSTGTGLAVTSNATIGGTLGVTGNASLAGTLGVTGASTLSGNTTVGGTLAVTGAITASSTINGTTIPTTKTLVTTVDTQTLTNKTLTSPTINTSTISGGTINNATIGETTASTGSFTSLSATSLSVTNTITGSVSGNAATATNGVVTSGSYSDPSWIASLSKSKVGLGNVPNTDCTNASNISSGTLGLARLGTLSTGQVVAGNAGTPTATTLSGDATIGATGTITLANSGTTAGTYGSSSQIPAITIDAKGRITSASNISVSTTPADGSITPSKLSQPLTRATAVAPTGGTAIDFTVIPSWVKRITVIFNAVSTNGTNSFLVQAGTSSGFVGSGYTSCGVNYLGAITNSTAGFILTSGNVAAALYNGHTIITNISGNIWVATSSLFATGSNAPQGGGGTIDLGGTLDRIRITSTGTPNSFDNGSVNIMYE